MKIVPDILPSDLTDASSNEIILPNGIVGFESYKKAELLYLPDHLPFLWMKLSQENDEAPLHFVVIEPGGIILDYEPELFYEDTVGLGIDSPSDVMVLNIVTLTRNTPVEATANLIGPIIVNRKTRLGRQLVISNYSRYSASHPVVENAQSEPAAATR